MTEKEILSSLQTAPSNPQHLFSNFFCQFVYQNHLRTMPQCQEDNGRESDEPLHVLVKSHDQAVGLCSALLIPTCLNMHQPS